jgi:hypothetical protein
MAVFIDKYDTLLFIPQLCKNIVPNHLSAKLEVIGKLVLHVLVRLDGSMLSCFTYTPILCRSIEKSCSCFSFI